MLEPLSLLRLSQSEPLVVHFSFAPDFPLACSNCLEAPDPRASPGRHFEVGVRRCLDFEVAGTGVGVLQTAQDSHILEEVLRIVAVEVGNHSQMQVVGACHTLGR